MKTSDCILNVLTGCIALAFILPQQAPASTMPEQPMGFVTPLEGDGYGGEVAVAGDYAIVGNRQKCQDTGSDFRTVEILVRNAVDGRWDKWRTLTPLPGRFRYFGWSVAIDGDIAVVGAPDFLNADAEGADAGSGGVFVYGRNQGGANNWGLVRSLTGFGPTFGSRVSLSGNALAVGEPRFFDEGRIHLHSQHQGGANLWGRVKSLSPSTPADPIIKGNAFHPFGSVFDLSSGRLAIGSSDDFRPETNEVEIHHANAGGIFNWGLEHTIPAPAGASDFGWSVALEGSRLAAAYKQDGSPVVGLYSGASFSAFTVLSGAGFQVFGPVAMGGDMLAVRMMEATGRVAVSTFRWPEAGGFSPQATRVSGYSLTRKSEGLGVSADSVLFGLDDPVSQSTATGAGCVRAMERTAGGADAWGLWIAAKPDLPGGGGFGKAMALRQTSHGDLLVVGNPDFPAGGTARGLVSVFRRSGDQWTLASRLSPPPGSTPGPMDNARFGEAVAVDSLGNILVGAPGENANDGAAYRFEPIPQNPAYQQEGLAYASPLRLTRGVSGLAGKCGASVAMESWVMLVGEPNTGGGVVSEWRSVGGGWGFALLTRTDPDGNPANDGFGTAMALDGQSLVVTAMGDETNGAAYYFEHNSAPPVWLQKQKIQPSDTTTGFFGKSVVLRDNRLVIGVFPYALFLIGPGNAFYFNRSGSTWTQKAFLRTPGLENGDAHGWASAIGKDFMLVGVPGDDGSGNAASNSGAAFLYNTYGGGSAASAFLHEIRPGIIDEQSGMAVAADWIHFAVSSPGSNLVGSGAGRVYCYRLGEYERWAANFPLGSLSRPQDDADQDGQNNLVEFAFESDPARGGSLGRLDFGIHPDGGANYLFATYHRPLGYLTDDLGVSLVGGRRADPASSSDVQIISDLGAILTGRLRSSTSAWPRGFMCLRLTYPNR